MWIPSEYDEFGYNTLEATLGSEVPHECSEIKDMPQTPWRKVHNGL